MRTRGLVRKLALLSAAWIVPACGGGGSSSPPPPDTPPTATAATPTSPQTSNVSISYTLSDPYSDFCSIVVEVSTDGGTTFSPALAGPGGDGTNGLTSSPFGTPHTFVWDSKAVGTGAPVTAIVRITPSDYAAGTPGLTGSFTVDNAGNTPPSAAVTTPASGGGLFAISYTLTDAQSNTCSIVAEYSVNSGSPPWTPATRGPGGEGTTLLTSSPGGTAHLFIWNSFADGVGTSSAVSTVRFRITPSDLAGGTPGINPADFQVDNVPNASGAVLGPPVQSNPTVNADVANAVASDDRSLYIVGSQDFGGDATWRIEKRSLPTGALDAGFGTGGVVLENAGGPADTALKIVIDSTYMYVLGVQDFGGDLWARLEKRTLSTGALVGAILVASLAGGAPVALAADAAYLYVGVSEAVAAPADYRWRIEKRLKLDGTLVAAFGTGGAVTDDPTANADLVHAIAIDGASMWIAGSYDGGGADFKTRLQKRSLADGALVGAFGAAGTVQQDLTAGADDEAFDIVQDATAIYVYQVVETGPTTSLFDWRVERINRDTGASIAFVATGGTDPFLFTGGNRLLVDGANLYLAGTHGSAADPGWRLEKRLLSNLGLVAAFGAGGVVTINPALNGFDVCLGVTQVGGVLFVVGADTEPGDRQWRLEALWK